VTLQVINNNHLLLYEKIIIKKERKKGNTNKYGRLDQNPYIKNLTKAILR